METRAYFQTYTANVTKYTQRPKTYKVNTSTGIISYNTPAINTAKKLLINSQ